MNRYNKTIKPAQTYLDVIVEKGAQINLLPTNYKNIISSLVRNKFNK